MGSMLLHVNAGTKRKKNTPSLLRESPEIGLKCHQEAQFEDLPSNLPSRTPLQGLHPQTHQLTTSSRPGDTLRSHIPYSPFPSSDSRKAPCQATEMKAWSLPSQSSLAGGECTKMERRLGWAETVQ